MTQILGIPLPKTWSTSPLKHVTSFLNRGTAPDYVDDGPVRVIGQAANQDAGIDWSRSRFHYYQGNPASLKGYLKPADVIINSTGTGTLGRVGFFTSAQDDAPCMADGHVSVARFNPDEVHSRFAYYWMRSQPFQDYIYAALVVGATNQIELNQDRLAGAPIPLPPLAEQRRIADFLDAETTRIDRLSGKRDQQIKALDERELSLIADMLSGGASPQDGQQTSWPWLPFIRQDWSAGPIYGYFSVELGKMLNPERASGMNQKPYLRNANVHWYQISTDDMSTMSFEANEIRRYSIEAGDLLVCEGGAGVAEAAVWDGRISECYYQKSLHRVRQTGSVPVEWLMYWLRLAKHCGVFESEGNLATIPHLTGEQLRQYRIPIPVDSRTLVRSMNAAIENLTTARERLRDAQAFLIERRQALITATVTGQIDVSTASGRGIEDGLR